MNLGNHFQSGTMCKQSIPPEEGELDIEGYMDNIVRKRLVAQDNSATYQDQRAVMTVINRAKYISAAIDHKRKHAEFSSPRDQTSDYLTVRDEYLRSRWGREYSGTFNVEDAHSWDEVIEMTRQAQARYENSVKRKSGIIRHLFRVTGNWSSTIMPWVELLPSDSYGSIACGAFKLVLGAVGDRADICERIADTFNRVQEFQIKVERHLCLYSESPEMRFCATETYISFLAMIQSMINTLVDMPTHKKIRDSLLKHRKHSSSYSGLNENEEQFYRQIQRLDEVAEHLHKETLVGVKEGMRSVDSGLQRTRRMIVEMFRQNKDNLKTIMRGIQDSEGKVISAGDARSVALLDSVKDLLTQYLKASTYQSSKGEQTKNKTSTTGSWVRDRLLKALGADLMPPEQDDDSAKKMVVILEKPFHSRVHALLRSDRFRDFLSSRESAFLPIISPWEDYATESFTPMSIISRALTECVAPLTDKRVVSFYCGFHTSRDDSFFGPIGLMKSLIIQLLRSDLLGSFDFNSVNVPAFRERLEAGDVRQLCKLFKTLVNKIPEQSILFCVIDGLSLFQAIEPELTSFTISALENTVQTMGWHAAFKVLTTTCGLKQMSSFQPLYLSEELYEWDNGGDLEGVANPEFDLMGEQGQLAAYKNATGTFILPEGCE